MGFAVSYISTRPVTPTESEVIKQVASQLCDGRTWLGCEPVFFAREESGRLCGCCKPTIVASADDAAALAHEGLPDGTIRDAIDVLCRLSRDHNIEWEISHDHSDGPIGYIRDGVCDGEVENQVSAFADLSMMLQDEFGLDDFD